MLIQIHQTQLYLSKVCHQQIMEKFRHINSDFSWGLLAWSHKLIFLRFGSISLATKISVCLSCVYKTIFISFTSYKTYKYSVFGTGLANLLLLFLLLFSFIIKKIFVFAKFRLLFSFIIFDFYIRNNLKIKNF